MLRKELNADLIKDLDVEDSNGKETSTCTEGH